MIKQLLAAAIFLAILPAVCAAELKRVAYDDAGEPARQPHLIDGKNWTFKKSGDSTPAACSAVFGNTVKFGYSNLNPQANYKAKITLFADACLLYTSPSPRD